MPIFTDECLDPGFGYENKDGYVRIWCKPKKAAPLVMRHRWFWELQKGPIPEGYEINHLCKNRRCCNVNHLECIDGSLHAQKSNKERYLGEFEEFKEYYAVDGELLTQEQWSHIFDCSQARICKWIKKIKSEGDK